MVNLTVRVTSDNVIHRQRRCLQCRSGATNPHTHAAITSKPTQMTAIATPHVKSGFRENTGISAMIPHTADRMKTPARIFIMVIPNTGGQTVNTATAGKKSNAGMMQKPTAAIVAFVTSALYDKQRELSMIAVDNRRYHW